MSLLSEEDAKSESDQYHAAIADAMCDIEVVNALQMIVEKGLASSTVHGLYSQFLRMKQRDREDSYDVKSIGSE